MNLGTVLQQAPVLAQFVVGGDLIHWIIVAIVIAGVIGIALVIARQAGIVIPDFIWTIAWIVLAVVVGVIAIRFLASMM